jgi:ubiquinone/menaquinone biosynthesis C-methylase UbiE
MKPQTVEILRSPVTHEPLQLVTEPKPDGSIQDVLVSILSGERFPLRDGIPVFLDESALTGPNQKYERFYNQIARFYDVSLKLFARLEGGSERKFRYEYLRELELRYGDRVLEVSIGTGANLHYLPSNARYYGLDISWGMLQQCQRNLKKWRRDAELFLGDAEALPFEDSMFDVVFHVGGINAFSDRAQAINEMIRVARPGTKIVIVDETAKLLKAFAWMPWARQLLREYGDRLVAPVALVPAGMNEVQTHEISKGKMYCLSLRKPGISDELSAKRRGGEYIMAE